jgi:chloramphenicol 3-O phosphotransferase
VTTAATDWPRPAGLGRVVVLNGAPRSGKSSIARAIQETFDEPWMNLGVDVFGRHVTPPGYLPGMGLRPGGVRPDLEALLPALYGAFYESVAAHSRHGLHVVVDVGHHDAYSKPLGLLGDAARRLAGIPAFLVGVQCPLEVIMRRRAEAAAAGDTRYEVVGPGGAIPEPVRRWQEEVHRPGIYDLEVDTSSATPEEAAAMIRARLDGLPPTAFAQLATLA